MFILTCSPVASLSLLIRYEPIEIWTFFTQTVSMFPSGTETTPQCSRTNPRPGNNPICSPVFLEEKVLLPSFPSAAEIKKGSVYLLRFSSRISAPLLLLMLLISDLMDSNAAFTSVATDLSQLFRRLHTNTYISLLLHCSFHEMVTKERFSWII